MLNFLAKIFIWWDGATLGTLFTIWKRSKSVGTDEFGNRYFEARDTKDSYDGRKRRWVIYKGYADASKIPPDWHGWMHYIYDQAPSKVALAKQAWEQPHLPNMSGTPLAKYPKGSLNSNSERAKSSGDYEAWKP